MTPGPDVDSLDPAAQVGAITEWALHELAIAAYREAVAAGRKHGRGIVVPLTDQERAQRMLYLARLATIDTLDPYVRRDGAPARCPDLFYLLKDHNGGKDPTAPDPADRWRKPDSTFENRTSDCIGGQAWAGGWDRFQPVLFAHLYGGWINTDSMRMECRRVVGPKSPRRCFERVPTPVAGGYVVFASGAGGHPVGHIGGTPLGAPAGWNENDRASWEALEVVDVAARTPRPANQLTTGLTWWNKDAYFVVPVMPAMAP